MPEFEITMGGYDREEVDHLVTTVEAACDGPDPEARQDALKAPQMCKSESFRRKFRGYSKIQVRNYVEDRLREISRSA
jgi:cell division septum initiation protein DivIVA